MSVLLAILSLVVFVCLVLLAGMHPVRPAATRSELQRRAKQSKLQALELRRYELHASLSTLLGALRTVLLVALVCLLVGAFGWLLGVTLALVLGLIYPALARMKGVRRGGARIYARYETGLLDVVSKFRRVLRAVTEPAHAHPELIREIYSHEDLAELIAHSEGVIGKHERQLLSSAMAFFGKTVQEVMTPRSVITSIKKSEFLGPLVLDELHAHGHSRLPVIADDLDHVVGILHLRDLLSLDIKRSTTAEKAVEPKVFYIHQEESLEHALAAFLKVRHHLFIVINDARETVGLLTLEDVMEALIGRHIVDEDDVHDDLRAVAVRQARANNAPAGHVDL